VLFASLLAATCSAIAAPVTEYPARTVRLPAYVAERLTKDMGTILDDEAGRAQLAERGIEVAPLSGPAFRQFAVEDLRKWKALSQRARISLD